MPTYKAKIFDHSGVFSMAVSPVEQTIEEIFEADSDQAAFTQVCRILCLRTFDPFKGLISNPISRRTFQRLDELSEGYRVIDCSGYSVPSMLRKDEYGRVFGEMTATERILGLREEDYHNTMDALDR